MVEAVQEKVMTKKDTKKEGEHPEKDPNSQKVRHEETKPEPKRRNFKTLEELRSFYGSIKARRVDGRVHSSSLEVAYQNDNLYLIVRPAKSADSGQTVPPGEYRMLDVGIVTFCRRLGMSFSYFSKYPKKDEIVEHMNVLNQNSGKHYVIRLLDDGDGSYVVQAVLPKLFVPIDNADILEVLGDQVTLQNFMEGGVERAIDVLDVRLDGAIKEGRHTYHPFLRIINSEVDMSPVFVATGVLAKDTPFISMQKGRGALRIPHRARAGDIRDHLKLDELTQKAVPIAASVERTWDLPLNKARTTDWFVNKIGVAGTDIEAVLTDFFAARTLEDNVWNYAMGLGESSKFFLVPKAQKVCDLAMAVVYGDIPTVA